MSIKNYVVFAKCLLLMLTINPTAVMATVVPISLNDFFSAEPEVSVTPDGQMATIAESSFVTPVTLINDPGFGDPEVIVPALSRTLTFSYNFVEALNNDDLFTAVLFDAAFGPFGGVLDIFELTSSATGVAEFDLSAWVGLSLGLSFELHDLDPFSLALDSTVTISNLALNDTATVPVPEPGTAWLISSLLLGLVGFKRKG